VAGLLAVVALANAGFPLLDADTRSAPDLLLEAMERHRRPGESAQALVGEAPGTRFAARRAGVPLLPIGILATGDCAQPGPGLLLTTGALYRELREGRRPCGNAWRGLAREPPYVLVRVTTAPDAGRRSPPR
jgi:hypothetical protein